MSNIVLTYIDNQYILYIDNRYIIGGNIMAIDKSLLTGSTTMLLLKLLEEKDMYGYML